MATRSNPNPNPNPNPDPDFARATEAELTVAGFSLTRLPKAAKKEKKGQRAPMAVVWPVDVVRAATAMAVELPDALPTKGASGPGTFIAVPSKDARSAFGEKPVRFPCDLKSLYVGPTWGLWVAQGGRYDDGQKPAFPAMAEGQRLPLVRLLQTLNPAELSGEAFGRLWTGAGSSGILRTVAQYSGRAVCLDTADFTVRFL